MIFYFSGTGNSLWVARRLGELFDEKTVSIAEELRRADKRLVYPLQPGERVFFVYPVHSWGPAVLVTRFMARLAFDGYDRQEVYSVCTCGDTCGDTDRIMRRALAARGVNLTQAYSVQMPNNYILMKGFGIDDEATRQAKLQAAPQAVAEIAADIRTRSGHSHYVRGEKPFLHSHIVYPLFRRFVVGRNAFHATDACTSCGLCARICPTQTISLRDGRPVWGKDCVQCTACIHHCPVRAIEYGRVTQGQGRYVHP